MANKKVNVYIRSVKDDSLSKLKQVAKDNDVTLGKAFDLILEAVQTLEIKTIVKTTNKKVK